jgi:hypothetical protein
LFSGVVAAQSPNNDRLPGEGGQEVAVKLLPPDLDMHQPLRFVLSEPAYVAAFIVYPGAGVRLLSPTIDTPERERPAGYNVDQLIGGWFDNDAYRVVLGPYLSNGPAYLYVVASRNPLDVGRYVHRPMRLASAIGEKEARSFYSDVAFDALLNNAVSLGDDTSWDSDVYMLWPGADNGRSTTSTLRYVSLSCNDGSLQTVPENYPFIGCLGQQRLRPVVRVERQQVQQSVSAADQMRSLQSQLKSSAPSQGATVLPTIIGAHISNADREAAVERRVASQRVMYTAANGEQEVVTRPYVTAPSEQPSVQVIDEQAGRARGGHERNRADYTPAERAAWQARSDNSRAAEAPRTFATPRQATSLHLTPNPVQRSEARMAQPREAPSVQRAPRSDEGNTTPRTSAPSMSGSGAGNDRPATPVQNRAGRSQ